MSTFCWWKYKEWLSFDCAAIVRRQLCSFRDRLQSARVLIEIWKSKSRDSSEPCMVGTVNLMGNVTAFQYLATGLCLTAVTFQQVFKHDFSIVACDTCHSRLQGIFCTSNPNA